MAGGEVIGEAANGIDAVELYFKLSPDLVLLDITMPGLDGVKTLNKIIGKDKNAKVIMISAVGHKEMICEAMRLGAKHFVTKPYNLDYAGTIIKSVIGKEYGGLECGTSI
jgi:two-component system chemotaxis response regulator CheY